MNAPVHPAARWARVLGIGLLVLSLLLQAGIHIHGPDPVADSFGFSAWYAVLSCFLLAGIARLLAPILTRREPRHDG